MFGTSFPFFFEAADLGRHASKVEAQNDVLAALARAAVSLSRECGYLGKPTDVTVDGSASQSRAVGCTTVGAREVCGELPGGLPTVARPIVASRIKLPGPPKFSLKPSWTLPPLLAMIGLWISAGTRANAPSPLK